jgi:hypothetical protein
VSQVSLLCRIFSRRIKSRTSMSLAPH